MSVKDIQYHLNDLYKYELSAKAISNITEKILEKTIEWYNKSLEQIYLIIFMDSNIKNKD